MEAEVLVVPAQGGSWKFEARSGAGRGLLEEAMVQREREAWTSAEAEGGSAT